MKRIPTKMEGLDDVLGGGIPDGSVVLVSGAPGTMKTSLTYHILHANALDGVRGLYVSLEQSRASLVDHTEGLGYRLEDTGGNLSILDLGMLRKKLTGPTQQPWMDLFKLYTQGIRKSFDYRLLVLDSLDALEILAKFREPRRDMFSLIHWLRDLHCTAFLLGELPTDSGSNGWARTAYATSRREDAGHPARDWLPCARLRQRPEGHANPCMINRGRQIPRCGPSPSREPRGGL